MRILILPDIPGWAVDSMADGIISSLGDKPDFTKNGNKFNFTKKFCEPLSEEMGFQVIDWNKEDFSKYDLIYVMLPSYINENIINKVDMKKVCTTFHGGPGTEGQAEQLNRLGFTDLKSSFVSYQTKKRITENVNKINRKMNIRTKTIVDETWLKGNLKLIDGDKILNLSSDEVNTFKMTKNKVHLSYSKKGYDLTNLHFTPHGVDIDRFKQDKIVDKPVFGYAGWSRYIIGVQKEHRRCDWILNAWKNDMFKLKVAGGVRKYDTKDDLIKLKYVFNNDNMFDIAYWEHKNIQDFYKNISCYLVPDKYAGGPMPVLEAGAMNIPVICSNAGLCGDMIIDGVHGIKIETFEEFKKAIDFMKNHKNEREQMGKKLGELVRETRSWEAVSKYWEDFFTK